MDALFEQHLPSGLGGEEKDKAMKQAQHIWTMLDEMSNSDPASYKKFIDKQMQEGKKSMEPPQPHMCVKTNMIVRIHN